MKNSKNNALNNFIKIIRKLEPEIIQVFSNTVFDTFKGSYRHKFEVELKQFEFSLDEFTMLQNMLTPEILSIIYETIHSQRKNHGVFYTSKQIVQYMCRESLNNYIKHALTIDSSHIFGRHTSPQAPLIRENGYLQDVIKHLEDGNLTLEQALIIDKALSNIKVCDPAVGCGAFAVGMLHEISWLRNTLSVYVNPDRTLYELKKHAVENSIFGADIDGGAVEVTKKRLWLSLLKENSLVTNLENIKFNIISGNSLTGEIDFLSALNYFDIVVANPPYVGEKGNKELFQEIEKGPLGKFHQGKMDLFYFFFHLALNIAKKDGQIAFITTNYFPTAAGAQKLRNDIKNRAIIRKIINFINLKLFNCAVGQHNMITFLQKSQNQSEKAQIALTRKSGYVEDINLQDILEFKDNETDYFEIEQKDLFDGEENYIRMYNSGSDSMVENILNKMKQNSIPLGEVCYIHQGLKTNADKVTQKHLELYPELQQNNIKKDDGIFVIQKNHDILKNIFPEEERFLKPLFKNCDIKKYFVKSTADEYVLFITNEYYLTKKDVSIKQHLDRFKPIIQNRAEIEPGGNIPLYAITRPRKDFMYNGPKIVAPYKSKSNTFGYNEAEWYASGDVYYINHKNSNYDLKYILALLNSKLYLFWLKLKGKRKGELLELYQKPLSEIPIKIMSKSSQSHIIDIVDKIINNFDIDNLLGEIDRVVYKLFELTKEEISIVEKFIQN